MSVDPQDCETVNIGAELAHELNAAFDRIRHCLDQLSDEQVWWRSDPAMNAIGNLLLHLAGNVRQYVISGLGGAVDVRDRPAEFSARGPVPKADLLAQLAATVAEASQVLTTRTAADWQRLLRVQTFDLSGLRCAMQSVAHFRGHAQEIICLTRLQLGPQYQFAYVPAATHARGVS